MCDLASLKTFRQTICGGSSVHPQIPGSQFQICNIFKFLKSLQTIIEWLSLIIKHLEHCVHYFLFFVVIKNGSFFATNIKRPKAQTCLLDSTWLFISIRLLLGQIKSKIIQNQTNTLCHAFHQKIFITSSYAIKLFAKNFMWACQIIFIASIKRNNLGLF